MDRRIEELASKYSEAFKPNNGWGAGIFYGAFLAGARAAIKIIQAEIDKSEGDIDFLAFKIDALASDGTEGGT